MDSDDELAQAHGQSWHEQNDLYDLLNIIDEIELAHSPEPPDPDERRNLGHLQEQEEREQVHQDEEEKQEEGEGVRGLQLSENQKQQEQPQQHQEKQKQREATPSEFESSEPIILHQIAAKRMPNASQPPKQDLRGYAPSMMTREDSSKKRTETPCRRGLRLFERIAVPQLTPEGAAAAGLVPARPPLPKEPRRSVLASSRLRKMRICRAGSRCSSVEPSLPSRPPSSTAWLDSMGQDEDLNVDLDSIGPLLRETPDLRKIGELRTPVTTPSPDPLQDLRVSSASPERWSSCQSSVSLKPPSVLSSSPEPLMSLAGTTPGHASRLPSASVTASQPQAASRPEAESVVATVTESWTARMPTATQRESQRHHRHKPVTATRPSSPVRLKTGSQRQSLLEERWIGNLDDPENDKELSSAAVLALLERTEIYHSTGLKKEDVKRMIVSMLNGEEGSIVAKVSGRLSKTVDPIQFMALISKIAHIKGISYCECLDRIVNHQGATKTKLEHFFGEFAHGTAQGFMTVYEFTRFCQAFGLFNVDGSRFVPGDVHFLFLSGSEGKCVDLSGFKRLLKQVADKLQMRMQELLHLLAEREAERASNARGMARTKGRKVSAYSTA